MRKISYKDIGLKYTLDPSNDPVAKVEPGESLIIDVEDASSGQIREPGDTRDREKAPYGNPLVGPLYIEGANQDRSISVKIKNIEPSIGQGATYYSEFNSKYFAGNPILKFTNSEFPIGTKICPVEDGKVKFSENISIPYDPMVGTIGVAPRLEEEGASSGVLPGRHGGNMDIPDIQPGSTVHLPVFYEGGLLYLGDAHGTQGDGEISGTAVEMPAEIEIEINVEDRQINQPRIETEDEMMFVACTRAERGLEDTIRTAFMELILWMEEQYGIDRYEGLMLCTQVGKIRIGNLWSVAAKIGKKYLK